MWKVVAVFAIGMSVGPASQKQPPAHPQTVGQDQSTQTEANSVAKQTTPENRDRHQYQYDPTEHHRDGLETAYLISGLVIGLLNFVTAFAIMKQISSQRKADRPWLLLTVIDQEANWFEENPKQWKQMAHWRVKNYGKTPAFIDSVTGHVSLVRDTARIKTLKFIPPIHFALEPVLAPGQESNTVYIAAEEFVPAEVVHNLCIKEPEFKIVPAGKIIYRDSFDKKHSSSFCYWYVFGNPEVAGFNEMCGPDSYNKYT